MTTLSSNNDTLLQNNIVLSTPIETLKEDIMDESTVVRSIHRDENQLRTLVVVLSLAGGLVLALTLGFGIYLYWHCCLRRKKRTVKALNHLNEKNNNNNNNNNSNSNSSYFSSDDDDDDGATDGSSIISHNGKSRDKHNVNRPEQSTPLSSEQYQPKQQTVIISTIPSIQSERPVSLPPITNNNNNNNDNDDNDNIIITRSPIIPNNGPAPSAPSAKELDIIEYQRHHHVCCQHSNSSQEEEGGSLSGSNTNNADYMLIYGTSPPHRRSLHHQYQSSPQPLQSHQSYHQQQPFHPETVELPEQPPPAYTSLTP
ncbi:hypothetical protein BDC45DRAFT_501789 [Circinella umbellata]|nr:hypothetical protein BDC45DRAFT_501789 [Circinella umbellata]